VQVPTQDCTYTPKPVIVANSSGARIGLSMADFRSIKQSFGTFLEGRTYRLYVDSF
jgi:hypothetical protein